MSKGNKKGGLKTAQVNNENNAASSQNAIVAAMASTTMGNSSMDRNHQVDLLKMIHDRCFLDQNATEHTGLSEEAIDKINHVNFLGMVTVYANEINSGNSDFAMVLRKAALPELMEACAEVGITLDETKLIESKKDDGTEIISVPSTAANIPEETKKNLDADKAAVEATKGKTYDPTKIKDENELKEALSGLLAINREEKFIESIYKAIGFWLSYQKIVANRELNTAKETLSKTKDKEYKAKAQEAVNTAQDRIKNLNSMSNTDVFREIVKITGRVGTLCYGIANHIILQTASTGSPISGFCCLHSASLNKETGICKYSDNELADIVKCLVEYEANNIRTKALKTIEEENALPEKDRVQSHIDTANKNIKFADKAMEAITNAPADFVANLKEKYLAKDNFAHKTVIAIKKAYYRGVTNDEWNRVKIDSLLDNCTQYAGVISNLFRDPNNQLAGYSLASADHLDFKTPEEVSAEKLEAEKAAAKAAEEKKKEDEEKKAAAIKKKEDEAKQKEKAAKKAAKAAAKAEAKEKTKK